MSETVALKKGITIELDVVSGTINVYNEDEISYIEMIAMLEYAKMMMMKDWMDDRWN